MISSKADKLLAKSSAKSRSTKQMRLKMAKTFDLDTTLELLDAPH
jgi:hypothetical protein